MTTKEKLIKIDNILASFEDWMHGIDGDNCTEARKLLSEIEVNNGVLDDVNKIITCQDWVHQDLQRVNYKFCSICGTKL